MTSARRPGHDCRPDTRFRPILFEGVNADMMSDMKTFTVRELDRSPSVVLDAAEAEGAVLVKRRDGRAYRIAPENAVPKVNSLPALKVW